MFADYAGQTVPITYAETGEVSQAQVFVAMLGASGYTFVDLARSQKSADFRASHTRAFAFFGSVPE